jgi:hypothetical protein
MFRIPCLILLALPLSGADFAITSFSRSSSNFSLTFPTTAGRMYGVERADALGQSWAVQATYCGTGSPITFTDPLRPSAGFYRVSSAASPALQLTPAQPTFTSAAVSLPDATVGQTYAIDIGPCPSGTAPFTFQISGAPPAGLTLTTTSDSVRIRGSATTASRTQFQVTVRDAANATVTKTYDIRAINPPPTILTEFVTLKAGQAANSSLSASPGTGSLSWSIDSGALPQDVNLSQSGMLTGTPGADAAERDETGLHSAVLRVTDQHTDRVTGASTPRSATRAVTFGVRLSYSLNIHADRPDGPSLISRCYGCHSEFFPPDIASGSGAKIIGASSNPSFSCPNRVYITPGQPEQSLIYKKLTAPDCGDRMPQGGPYMTAGESNRMLRWILELKPGDQD